MSATLSGPERKPLSGGAPKQLVVILHGWGADGANLIDIADMLAPALPDAHFIAPNGPEVCEVNPYGYQWFSLMDRNPARMLEGARRAEKILNQFLDEALTALSPAGQTLPLALVGFSQGTMLSLHAALRRTPAVAAVAGFSGALIAPELLPSELAARPPVCLIHGQIDDVVPYASLARAEAALKENAVPTETHTRPGLGHSIDLEGIEIAKRFLKKAFG